MASGFIRHVKYCHRDKRGVKATYMKQMANEVGEDVVKQLHRAKWTCIKKRKFVQLNPGPEVPEGQRIWMDDTGSSVGHYDCCEDQGAMQPARVAKPPLAAFDDLTAPEHRDRAKISQVHDISATKTINFDKTSCLDTGIATTEVGRYDPDITRIANWPASWGQMLGHNDRYEDQDAMQPALVAKAPLATFDDVIALERRNRAKVGQLEDIAATTTINFGRTSCPDAGIATTEVGRYDPDITRIANWPASWDQMLDEFSDVSSRVL